MQSCSARARRLQRGAKQAPRDNVESGRSNMSISADCTETAAHLENHASVDALRTIDDTFHTARCFRVPQKECGKRSSITFFHFRDSFGHFLVTFSDASVTFFVTFLPNSFCRTPFAAG